MDKEIFYSIVVLGFMLLAPSFFNPLIPTYSASKFSQGPYLISFSGGDGTPDDPFHISNITQLQSMSDNLSAHYILINDINASEIRNWNAGNGFQPIGNETDPFIGDLDGNGHSISDLIIDRPNGSYIGLIGYLGPEAKILNLSIQNASYNGRMMVGGISGYMINSQIINCVISGDIIKGSETSGGIVGMGEGGYIANCHSDIDIENKFGLTGGLVGLFKEGMIRNCTSKGDVSVDSKGGGLVGETEFCSISNSSAKGNVTGESLLGGLIGHAKYGTVERCFASGNIIGSDRYLGGLIGYCTVDVEDCYALGDVSGRWHVGGLLGMNYYVPVTNSYSTGRPTGEFITGGLVGNGHRGDYTACFWDTDTSNMSTTSGGGLGKNTIQMMNKTMFQNAGWNINTTWNIIDGKTYPFLRSHDYGVPSISTSNVLSATEDRPYIVEYEASSKLPGGWGGNWDLKTNATNWLRMDQNGTLYGTPANDDVGSYWVNVTTSIFTNSSSSINFTLDVINVNDPPMILTSSIPSVLEDEFYEFQLQARDVDPDMDELNWSMETEADFLDLDPVTGVISGTATNHWVGSWNVSFFVTDGDGEFDVKNLTLVVENSNDDPEIIGINDTAIMEDSPFHLKLHAKDMDPTEDILSWMFSSNAEFLHFDKWENVVYGKPENKDVGIWWIEVIVNDGNGGTDQSNFTLEVLNVNDGPTSDNQTRILELDEDTSGSINLMGIFSDVDGDSLVFIPENSTWIDVSICNGIATFVPHPDKHGLEVIEIAASDGYLNASINIRVIVNSVNDAPRDIRIVHELLYFEDSPQIVYANAEDVDLRPDKHLNFTWTSNISGYIGRGIAIDLSLLNGFHRVTLTVTDDKGASSNLSFSIEVRTPLTMGPDMDIEKEDRKNLWPIISTIFLCVLIMIFIVVVFRRKEYNWDEE